jgi:hypothetical protein
MDPGNANSEGIFRPATAATASVLIWIEHCGKAPPGAAIAGFGLVWWFRSSLHYRGPVHQKNF